MALLGIAQREMRVIRTDNSINRKPPKAFPTMLETFGDHLRVARYELGLTQRQLAAKTGIESIRIQAFETDQVEPAQSERAALRQILGANLPDAPIN